MNLYQVAEEIAPPAGQHLPAGQGRPPAGLRRDREVPGRPALARLVLFYEYFHGDNGAGLGASHQTGWTGIVARMMHLFATSSPEAVLELGKAAVGDSEVEQAEVPATAGSGEASRRMDARRYPGALPDQHPRLADGAVPPAGPAGDAGRHPGRRAGSPGRDGLRLGLAAERLADRPAGRAGVARAIPSGGTNSSRPCPTSRDEDIAGSGFAITGYTVAPGPRRRRRPWPACASGSGTAACD